MPRDENGIDPKAKDGQPDEKVAELESERRRLREQREEQATGMSDHGRAIDDQPEPSEEELFPLGSIEGDDKVTMKNIVPAGKPRKTEAKMGSTAIPLRGGLVRYGKLVRLLVTVEAGKAMEVPDLEDDDAGGERKLLGVKDVQHFRPVHVGPADAMFSLDQVLDILERDFAIPRSADKVRAVFGLDQPAAAAAG